MASLQEQWSDTKSKCHSLCNLGGGGYSMYLAIVSAVLLNLLKCFALALDLVGQTPWHACMGYVFLFFLNSLLHSLFISLHREGAVNGKGKHESNSSRKERPQKRGGGGRFEPYGHVNKRYRVFVSNIPYDVKWQALKDLMKEKGKVFG